jgi:hypothetical protein
MMKVKRKSLSLLVLCGWILLVVARCNPINSPEPSEGIPSPQSVPATEIEGVVTQMTPSATPFPSGPENLLNLVKADLAQRLSISAAQINVVESEQVEWSDSSLGCPQPDMFYMQVITPGYRIVLEANGQQYEYHSNRDASFVYCENPNPSMLPKP